MRKLLLAAAAATAIVSTAAFASVTFDYGTGTGFVGKGDVTTLYGWNNAQATANFNTTTLGFYTESSADYQSECTWTTGQKKLKVHHKTTTTSVNQSAAVSFANRSNKNGTITGINLTGYGATTQTGDDVPNLGDACLGEGTGGTITEVILLSSTDPLLYVINKDTGVAYPLPNTPVL